ncbi:MAG: hypothetical protein QM710_14425 [Flavobacterium sp.]
MIYLIQNIRKIFKYYFIHRLAMHNQESSKILTWKYWRKNGLVAAFSLAIVCLLLDGIDFFGFDTADEHSGFGGAFFRGISHAWIEIFSAILVYFLIEKKIEDYTKVPSKVIKKDYDHIISKIAKSKDEVRILDNNFNTYFVIDGSVRTQDQARIKLEEKLETSSR